MKIRPYIQYFHTSKYVSDLANGNICAVILLETKVIANISSRERYDNANLPPAIARLTTRLWNKLKTNT